MRNPASIPGSVLAGVRDRQVRKAENSTSASLEATSAIPPASSPPDALRQHATDALSARANGRGEARRGNGTGTGTGRKEAARERSSKEEEAEAAGGRPECAAERRFWRQQKGVEMYHRVEIVLRVFLSACLTLVMRDRSLPRQRSPYPPMGVKARMEGRRLNENKKRRREEALHPTQIKLASRREKRGS
eukprot:scaffold121408_cov30-Tisochrysis_lutea.AAC.16